MPIKSNIPQVLAKLQRVRDAVSQVAIGDIQDVIAAAVNTGRGVMIKRIFNDHQDANGQSLGNYTGNKSKLTTRKYAVRGDDPEDAYVKKQLKKLKKKVDKLKDQDLTEYEKTRLLAGRQVSEKDLEFSGSLRKSIETVRKEGAKVVVEIVNPENAKIARWQEKQIGNIRAKQDVRKGGAKPARIFSFSQGEYETIRKQGKYLIGQVIIKKMKGE